MRAFLTRQAYGADNLVVSSASHTLKATKKKKEKKKKKKKSISCLYLQIRVQSKRKREIDRGGKEFFEISYW